MTVGRRTRVEVVGTVFRVTVMRDGRPVGLGKASCASSADRVSRAWCAPVENARRRRSRSRPRVRPRSSTGRGGTTADPEEAAPVEEDPRAPRRGAQASYASKSCRCSRSCVADPPAAPAACRRRVDVDGGRSQAASAAASARVREAARAGRGTLDGHNAIWALAHLKTASSAIATARASYERYLRRARGALASARQAV
jgi:hypothetical protein